MAGVHDEDSVQEFTAYAADPAGSWIGGDAQDMDAATGVLDDRKAVQPGDQASCACRSIGASPDRHASEAVCQA